MRRLVPHSAPSLGRHQAGVDCILFRQLRLRSQPYALLYLPSSWDVVPDWERECESVAEAPGLLPRSQLRWTTLDRVSFGIPSLTHSEREAVIDLTRTQLEKAKSL